ncbi:MAG: TldD/PmbA family protein [Chloroflexota bacterium]|nr:TldD/PmbA family protein [Chloroflexota bacterium]
MDQLLLSTLDTAKVKGAEYADIRSVETSQERFVVRNGAVETITKDESTGFGIRVLINGAWGFASSPDITSDNLNKTTALAIQIAKASASHNRNAVDLGPAVTSKGTYITPIEIDPFKIPLDQKIDLLLESDKSMASVKKIRSRLSSLVFIREHKIFANTEGAYTDQTIYESGGGIQSTAVGDSEVQRRSYPQMNGRQQGCAGWEYITSLDIPGNSEKTAMEAAALLTAESCPTDIITDVIIGGSQLALQVHESCGHPIELDRVLGEEAAYAGTSFLTPDKLNNFSYGSEYVNITADSLRTPGLGSFGWDDEGVPSQTTPIVSSGQFVGYLMSRESASTLGLTSNGCMRASSWNRLPMIRMTNVSLEAGTWSLDDLISDTDSGIFMETNRSWSIDDRRYNFQFGTEMGYEIKNGKIGKLLKNCTYTGITPEFWNSCDAVCNSDHWVMWGTPNCGKGQPGQIGHTGHGASPARFRNIRVGVLR